MTAKAILAVTLGSKTPVPDVPTVTPPAAVRADADLGHLTTPGPGRLPFLQPGWSTGRRGRSSPPGGRGRRPALGTTEVDAASPRARSSPPGERSMVVEQGGDGDGCGDLIPAVRAPAATAPAKARAPCPPSSAPPTASVSRVLYAAERNAAPKQPPAAKRAIHGARPAWGCGPGAPRTEPPPDSAPARRPRPSRRARPRSAASTRPPSAPTTFDAAAEAAAADAARPPLEAPPLAVATAVVLDGAASKKATSVTIVPPASVRVGLGADAATTVARAALAPGDSPSALLAALAPCFASVISGVDACIFSVGAAGARSAVDGGEAGVAALAAAALMLALPAPATMSRMSDPPLTLTACELCGRAVDLLSDAEALGSSGALPPLAAPLAAVSVHSPSDAAVAASLAAGRATHGTPRVLTLRVRGGASLFLAAASTADAAPVAELARAAAVATGGRARRPLPWRASPLTRALKSALAPGSAAAFLLHVDAGDGRKAAATLALGTRASAARRGGAASAAR
jgi:hypothetical protein